MTEQIGVARSAVIVNQATWTLIRRIQNVRQQISYQPKLLDEVSNEVDSVRNSLLLVNDERALRTDRVQKQVYEVGRVLRRLTSCMDDIAEEEAWQHSLDISERRPHEDHLSELLLQLRSEKFTLHSRISAVVVGLQGRFEEGFRLAVPVLHQINERVWKVLNTNLVIWNILRHRLSQHQDEYLLVDPSEIDGAGVLDLQITSESKTCTDAHELYVARNTTVEASGFFTGNLGFVSLQDGGHRKTTVVDNKFGIRTNVMNGDVADSHVETFVKAMFK